MAESDLVVGIDLGTTNSLIGTVHEGHEVLFGDASGSDFLPSVVGADPSGRVIVGRVAKNRRIIDPEGTAVSVKRLMGKDVKVRVGAKQLTPPQVSALILGALLDRAQERLGRRPQRAVITVPAYFDDTQREATRSAGELAGVVVERLVNEPTAAAMTYQTGAEACVMVYDFGGGTFDVSILDRDEGFLEVRASRGDTQLGGDDIDKALCDLVLERIGERKASVESDVHATTRLLEAIERAKIALSDRDEIRLFDPFLAGDGGDAVHLDMSLTREDVEMAARPYVQRTLQCIDEALQDAKITPLKLDRVLLVGGTSKMPLVAAMVSKHLGRPVIVDENADRAVAMGASLLAGRAAGADVQEVLVDITPHTLAIGVVGDPEDPPDNEDDLLAARVIARGEVVPIERQRTVMTRFTDQPAVMIPVVQGEEPFVGDNTWLGHVTVEDLPPSPAHSPVEVTFRLDLSGVLHARAKHVPSGKDATVVFADSPYRLTAQERRAAKAEVDKLRLAAVVTTPESRADEQDLSLAKAMLARGKRALEKVDGTASAEARSKVAMTLEQLEKAIEKGDPGAAELTDQMADALLDLT